MSMIPLPIPDTLLTVTWFGMGLIFGRAFGKKIDWEIQQSEWFKRRSKVVQFLVKGLLDFTHHWWMGALLMVYVSGVLEVYWFGCGLLVDDFPDVPRRIQKYFKFRLTNNDTGKNI